MVLGVLGMAASFFTFVLVVSLVSGANESMRGVTNPLALAGAPLGIAVGVVALALPVITVVFPLNCLGLVLGGVGVCRAEGRQLSVLGLALNGIPVFLSRWAMRAIVSAL